ncbi:MAG TPA: EAL domain-containing protein, partial [Baekduia sp.]|nr:EAL domain-containing protein [Baekduia sp.]
AALVLELVEERLARSPDRLRPPTMALAALGVRIALDDFGEGATSLSQFGRLPLHQVKLARVFARNVGQDGERRAVLAAVVSLADEMELEVVVEGVESEAQVAELRGLGAELAQGFWFSPPRRPSELVLDGYSPRALPGLGDPSMVREFMRQIGLPARIM